MKQGSTYAKGNIRSCVVIDNGACDDLGFLKALTFPLENGNSSHALEYLVVSGLILEGPDISIARKRTINYPWINFFRTFVVNSQPGRHARPKVVNCDVCGFNQPQQHRQALRIFQIETDT